MQQEQSLGFAIIGCGLIGKKRLAPLPTGTLRFACDLDMKRAEERYCLGSKGSKEGLLIKHPLHFGALRRDSE
jgi:hypothetical protein